MAKSTTFHREHDCGSDRRILECVGGVVQRRAESFAAGGDFLPEWFEHQISAKEMFALHEVLHQYCKIHPGSLRWAQYLVDVDNQSVVHAF